MCYETYSIFRNAARERAVRTSSAPEIRLAQPLVLEQVGRLALEHELPGREHVAPIGEGERDVRVLLDDEHRDARFVHLLDDLEAALDEDRREAHRGLVHQHQLRAR